LCVCSIVIGIYEYVIKVYQYVIGIYEYVFIIEFMNRLPLI